jgi:hypothetical protein
MVSGNDVTIHVSPFTSVERQESGPAGRSGDARFDVDSFPRVTTSMTEQQPDQTAPTDLPLCPRCQGPMWDNRVGKRNPKAPDFKCKDRECDGVIWPPRDARQGAPATTAGAAPAPNRPAASGSAKDAPAASSSGMPLCPICGGPMWDDRATKRNPRAPDFKCRNKPKERGGPGCEGVIWPARDGSPSPYPAPEPRRTADTGPSGSFRDSPSSGLPPFDDAPPHDDDDLPF